MISDIYSTKVCLAASLPYLFLLQIWQKVLKNNWITANQTVIFSHSTTITELILKRVHAYSGFSLQLTIENPLLFKRLSSCSKIHKFSLTLKFGVPEIVERSSIQIGKHCGSHVGVPAACTATTMLVSAPLCKWRPAVLYQTALCWTDRRWELYLCRGAQ